MTTPENSTEVTPEEKAELLAANPISPKVLIAYHANCIDGFTAAWACHKGLVEVKNIASEDITLWEAEYHKIGELRATMNNYDIVYIVDFSLSLDDLLVLQEVCHCNITIIDHHKTAFESYESNLYLSEDQILRGEIYGAKIVFSAVECGASLVWNHFFPGASLPKLLSYVRDYDLWQWKLPDTAAINKYLRVQPKHLKYWDTLYLSLENPTLVPRIIERGEAIQAYHDALVEAAVAEQAPIELTPRLHGACTNCSLDLASDVGQRLATISGTYGAVWQQLADGSVKWSLHSIAGAEGEIDVAALAEQFGGGGHRNAAGFVLSKPVGDPWGVQVWSCADDVGYTEAETEETKPSCFGKYLEVESCTNKCPVSDECFEEFKANG